MILYITSGHNAHKLSDTLQRAIRKAQDSNFDKNFARIEDFLKSVCEQLKINIKFERYRGNAKEFSDKSFGDFRRFFADLLEYNNYPKQPTQRIAISLASRAMLLRAFDDPDAAVSHVTNKIIQVINSFPKNAADIECGKNKGDVLDPFILAATQYLLYQGDFESAISATVSHKALMIIEGLIGHLHEDVLGMMRGNVRIPEPRGKDQEAFDYITNPFPGADLIQPPAFHGDNFKIHQIKSKTGSAKGGDGKRLGDQLNFLAKHYDANIYYDALIGNTLIGHRSKAGVEKAAPQVRVVVGKTAFFHITGSMHGAGLLLRLYQESLLSAANETNYSLVDISKAIVACFQSQSEELGESFLDSILVRSTAGDKLEQDSFLFNSHRKNKKNSKA